MHLYDGMMMSAPSNQPGQLNRIYYKQDELRVKDVANVFKTIDADTTSKGDREMSVCEMQAEYEKRNIALQNAYSDSLLAVWRIMKDARGQPPRAKAQTPFAKAGGIGALYCNFVTKNSTSAIRSSPSARRPPSRRCSCGAPPDRTRRITRIRPSGCRTPRRNPRPSRS